MALRLKHVLRRFLSTAAPAPLVRNLGRREPIILMFHGVSTGECPQWLGTQSKHLLLDTFVEQMRLLKRVRRVIPLVDLVDGLRNNADLRGTVAITFDDGYRNNALCAAPVLIDLGLPAAFFLATGFIGTDRWIWTDRLERTLALTRLPGADIPLLGRRLPLCSQDDRLAALHLIKSGIKRLPNQQVDGPIAEIEAACGVDPAAPDGDARFMNWDEARQLASAGFEIGAHTINHPILSQLSMQRAREEILGSRDHIVAKLGSCSPVFCYPNGRSEDYTPAVRAMCRAHFSAALSTNRGTAQRGELHELRRFGAPGCADALTWLLLRPR